MNQSLEQSLKNYKKYKHLIVDNGSPNFFYNYPIKEISDLKVNFEGDTLIIKDSKEITFFNLKQIERVILTNEDYKEKSKGKKHSFFYNLLNNMLKTLNVIKEVLR